MGKVHRQRVEREVALLKEPETLSKICALVAGGSTLAKWCRVNDVRFHPVYEWVLNDPGRAERYRLAQEARKAFLSDKVLDGMSAIVDGDIRNAYDENNQLLDVKKLPDDVARILTGLELDEVTTEEKGTSGKTKVTVTTRTGKIKTIPQDKGLEMLGKHLGMMRDKVEVTGPGGGAIKVEEVMRNLTKLPDSELAILAAFFQKLGIPLTVAAS